VVVGWQVECLGKNVVGKNGGWEENKLVFIFNWKSFQYFLLLARLATITGAGTPRF